MTDTLIDKPSEEDGIVTRCDMNMDSSLQIIRQEDGDFCLRMMEKRHGQYVSAGMEICTPCHGGGKHPKLYKALADLWADHFGYECSSEISVVSELWKRTVSMQADLHLILAGQYDSIRNVNLFRMRHGETLRELCIAVNLSQPKREISEELALKVARMAYEGGWLHAHRANMNGQEDCWKYDLPAIKANIANLIDGGS